LQVHLRQATVLKGRTGGSSQWAAYNGDNDEVD